MESYYLPVNALLVITLDLLTTVSLHPVSKITSALSVRLILFNNKEASWHSSPCQVQGPGSHKLTVSASKEHHSEPVNALVLLTSLHLRTVATAAISGCIFGPKVFQPLQILSLIQEVSAGLHSSLSTLRHTLPSHRAERFLLSCPRTRSSCLSS